MYESDEEDFVSIGNVLSQYAEDEVPKKPIHIQQQNVTDTKGRPRFHGAFTGGFSAGYFNTVGTKEGWTPSTFVSQRKKDAEENESMPQLPEDFMDDEDFGEHGIAPRQVAVANVFNQQQNSQKRKITEGSHAHSGVIPGDAPLQDLVVPSSVPMGIKLLRKLGWKEGQGIGPRVQRQSKHRNKKNSTGKKTYGCALPQVDDSDSSSSENECIPENVTFAPKDVNPIKFRPKNDLHGLGYSGLNVKGPLTGISGHINLFEPMAITKKPVQGSSRGRGRGKLGMRGSAFGVGALEDDDEDIYAVDNMANYDRVLMDNTDKSFGWTAPKHQGMSSAPVGYIGKVLEGFKLSTINLKPKQIFPPPQIPRDFIPRRQKPTTTVAAPPGIPFQGSRQSSQTPKQSKKKVDATVRSAMLGEIGSVFDLVGDKDKERIQNIKSEPMESAPSTSQTPSSSSVPSTPRVPSMSIEEARNLNVPLNMRGAGGFKPFTKDSAKQQRYENFLELKKHGVKYEPNVAGMTEWERQKEVEDFNRAAELYSRPMSTMIASRFTTAKYGDDVKNVDMAPQKEKTDDRKKAVEMKMFGKMTRENFEWHPDKFLCKRFNIANPYPESYVVGVPGGTKKENFSSFNFLEENQPTDEVEEDDEPQGQDETPADIKPLAILAGGDAVLQSVSSSGQRESTVHVDLTEDAELEPVKKEPTERPSMDIFKAIFSNSEDSSDSDDEDEEQVAGIHQNTPHTSGTKQQSTLPSTSVALTPESSQAASPSNQGSIPIHSLEKRLSPNVAADSSDIADNSSVPTASRAESMDDSYGPALPPVLTTDSALNGSGKKKDRQKRKHKHKLKEKKKKSKHKKHKGKEKKEKKKDKKKKKDRKKEAIVVVESSSSSGSEADEDTDSDTNNQPSNTALLDKLRSHPGLSRMKAADFM